MKKYLTLAIILFFGGCVFFGLSYFYLDNSLENGQKTADIKQENIPYAEIPENRGLLFCLPNNEKILFFLDFREKMSYIIYIDNDYSIPGEYAGYPIDFEFDMDYYALSSVFDRLGGLDLELEGEVLRYTGVQVCDLLYSGSPDVPFKVVSAFCKRVSETGFTTDDFIFLIDNTGTDLTVPECIFWQDYIKAVFSNAVFVNWEI